MPLRNILIFNFYSIAISYHEAVREQNVSNWHLGVQNFLSDYIGQTIENLSLRK